MTQSNISTAAGASHLNSQHMAPPINVFDIDTAKQAQKFSTKNIHALLYNHILGVGTLFSRTLYLAQ